MCQIDAVSTEKQSVVISRGLRGAKHTLLKLFLNLGAPAPTNKFALIELLKISPLSLKSLNMPYMKRSGLRVHITNPFPGGF